MRTIKKTDATANTPRQLAKLIRTALANGMLHHRGSYFDYGLGDGFQAGCGLGLAFGGWCDLSGLDKADTWEGRVAPLVSAHEFLQTVVAPVLDVWFEHPGNGQQRELSGIIVTLNDHSMWTIEQIVSWIESLEPETADNQLAQEFFAGVEVQHANLEAAAV